MKTLVKIILILIINAVMSVIIRTDFVKSSHFNLITVNSVFIGFLFTSLSMLMGFLKEEIVQFFEAAGALKKVYNNIEKGILFSLSSIGIALLNLTILEKYINSKYILNYFYSLELLLLIITLYFLLFTILNLKIVVDSIRIGRIKKNENDQADKELKNLLKK
jgi:hypothetical protein